MYPLTDTISTLRALSHRVRDNGANAILRRTIRVGPIYGDNSEPGDIGCWIDCPTRDPIFLASYNERGDQLSWAYDDMDEAMRQSIAKEFDLGPRWSFLEPDIMMYID